MCWDPVTESPLPPPKRRHKQYPARKSASASQASSAVPSMLEPAFSKSRAAEADGTNPSGRQESVGRETPVIHTEFHEASLKSGQTKIRGRFVRDPPMPVLLRAQIS